MNILCNEEMLVDFGCAIVVVNVIVVLLCCDLTTVTAECLALVK